MQNYFANHLRLEENFNSYTMNVCANNCFTEYNNNNKPNKFPYHGVWEGRVYANHTTTSEKVERLFPIDPRLRTDNSIANHKT